MVLDQIDRRSSSLSGTVYLKIREAILQGDFPPGASIKEEQLASMLGVSRAPLREALARLDQDGFVETTPYHGSVVSSITRADVIQIMQVREPLECLSIRLAIELIPQEEIEAAIRFIEARRVNLEQGDVQAHFECNQIVHGLAPHHSGNRYLVEFLTSLEERTHIYRLAKDSPQEEFATMAEEHLAILEAFGKRDSESAIELLIEHLELTRRRLGPTT